eukprot:GHVQ01029985.1.p1 GENE.GHVQ01029985.1~~GHVQ01029985.1.p1  ORF type:complete len:852 (+),score=155.43 GHVQ01029985.1:468-3023(+)
MSGSPHLSSVTTGNDDSRSLKRTDEGEKGQFKDVGRIACAVHATPEKTEGGNTKPSRRPAMIAKEPCHYCLAFASVPGMITITRESIAFEPVCRQGIGTYQAYIDIQDVIECGFVAAGLDPGEDGGYFLQLLLRTLDGRKRYHQSQRHSYYHAAESSYRNILSPHQPSPSTEGTSKTAPHTPPRPHRSTASLSRFSSVPQVTRSSAHAAPLQQRCASLSPLSQPLLNPVKEDRRWSVEEEESHSVVPSEGSDDDRKQDGGGGANQESMIRVKDEKKTRRSRSDEDKGKSECLPERSHAATSPRRSSVTAPVAAPRTAQQTAGLGGSSIEGVTEEQQTQVVPPPVRTTLISQQDKFLDYSTVNPFPSGTDSPDTLYSPNPSPSYFKQPHNVPPHTGILDSSSTLLPSDSRRTSNISFDSPIFDPIPSLLIPQQDKEMTELQQRKPTDYVESRPTPKTGAGAGGCEAFQTKREKKQEEGRQREPWERRGKEKGSRDGGGEVKRGGVGEQRGGGEDGLRKEDYEGAPQTGRGQLLKRSSTEGEGGGLTAGNIFVLFKFEKKHVAQSITGKLIECIDEVAARTHGPGLPECTLTTVPFDSNGLLERWMALEDAALPTTRQEEGGTGPADSTHQKEPSGGWVLVEAPTQMDMQDNMADLDQRAPLTGVPDFEIPEGGAQLLTSHIASEISNYLPPTLAIKSWKLAFCPKLHGVSFSTFYRNVSDRGACVLLVKDTKGTVFGGFSSESFHLGHKYYGSGQMFVFTFRRETADTACPTSSSSTAAPIRVFHWSSSNAFFLFSDKQTIAIGGGGHYAITVDRDLLIGSSTQCPTFNSPCLASKEDFIVKELQVWVFDDY